MEEIRVDMRNRDAYDREIYAKHASVQADSDQTGSMDRSRSIYYGRCNYREICDSRSRFGRNP